MKKLIVIMLIILSLTSISSAVGLKLEAVAPQIGVLFPEDPWETGFEIGAIANMGEFYQNIGLYPLVNYWTTGGDISFSNFQLGADVHYKTEDLKGFFAGLGLSFNFVSVSTEILGVSYSDSEFDVGLGLFAGYEMPIDKYTGFVKGKYNLISDVNTFELVIGLYFDVGR
jgi:hypothetical protein